MQTTDTLRKKIAELVDCTLNYNMQRSPLSRVTLVPPSGKVIGATELKYMVEASLDGWLTTGRFNEQFEKELAEFIGIKH